MALEQAKRVKPRPAIGDAAAKRILTGVHDIARWQHRLSKADLQVETRLEEPILDAVLDALGTPKSRRRREPLYTTFYSIQDRPLTEKELDVLITAAKELARGEDPDALEALREDF